MNTLHRTIRAARVGVRSPYLKCGRKGAPQSTVHFCAGKQPNPGADPLIGCPGFATDLLISYRAL